MKKTNLLWKTGYTTRIDLFDQLNRSEGDPYPPFLWQSEFEDIISNRLVSLTASTGAGKSHAIKVSSIDWTKNSKNKSIIIVPRLGIGEEFASEDIQRKDRSIEKFEAINLCSDSEQTVRELINFIENSNTKLPAALRTIVCCVPTLALAYDRLKDKRKFKNIKLIIDEAHHCSTGEDTDGNFNANKLGDIFVETIRKKSNSVLLVTATHFRSDRRTIIPSRCEKQFVNFEVPFYRVQEECRQYNKQISFGYALFKKHSAEGVGKAFDPKQKTIIFAHRNSAAGTHAKKDKYIRDCIKEMGCEIVKEDFDKGCFIVKRGRKKLVIADLIHPKRSKNAAAYIKQVSKTTKSYDIDVIFALERFKEGCDYPPLQHCIIDGIRESYGDIIQMFGRVTRDYKGKENCHATILIENRVGYKSEDVETKTQNHLKYIIACMSIADFFKPYNMRIKDDSEKSGGYSGVSNGSPLSVLGDREAQLEFLEKSIMKFTARTSDKPECKKSYDKRLEIMLGVVKELLPPKLKKHTPEIAEQILIEMAATIKVNDNGMDISKVDINFLKKVDTTEFAHRFLSMCLSPREFKGFKDRVYNYLGEKRSMEEHIEIHRGKAEYVGEPFNKIWEREKLGKLGYYRYPNEAF